MRRYAVVDEVRVLRLLRAIADDLAVLLAESGADERRRSDPLWLRGIKYAFVTAIEAVVDVAQHVCSTQGWGPPRDNGDAVRLLGAHGAISAEVASSIRQAVGFRNVLVHGYVEVDDTVVVARIEGLADIDAFIREMAALVESV
ncbi:hypothetical protein BH24ACT11_BH24ACT11_01440 [soil metagenome]